MNILLTCGTVYIGSHTATVLADADQYAGHLNLLQAMCEAGVKQLVFIFSDINPYGCPKP